MAGKPKKTPEQEAALVLTHQERTEADQNRKQQQEQREALIAQCYEVVGRVQATNLMAKFANVSTLVWLRQVKESKIYRDWPTMGTWGKFCDYIGLSRQKIDEDLMNLSVLGEDFLTTCQQFSVGYRDLRKLRQLTYDGALVIDAGFVEIAGERIPFGPDHKDDIQVLLDQVLKDKNKQVEDARGETRAKDKALKEKSEFFQKLEHAHSDLKKKLFINTDEAAFIKDLDIAKFNFEEIFMRSLEKRAEALRTLAVNSSTGQAPDLMKAALLASVHFMRTRILGLYSDFEIEFSSFKNNPEALADFEKKKNSTIEIDPEYLNTPKG
jgi:hypothetical protein